LLVVVLVALLMMAAAAAAPEQLFMPLHPRYHQLQVLIRLQLVLEEQVLPVVLLLVKELKDLHHLLDQ